MHRDPIRQLQINGFVYLLFGIALLLFTLKFGGGLCAAPVLLGLIIYILLFRAFNRFFRASQIDRDQLRDFQRIFQEQFSRQNLPRQVFWLLFAVAEADGVSEEAEREIVRKFLLERFTDPATAADLREWEANRIPPEQVSALALGLGRILSVSERETVFSWCCRVAFADDSYQTEEHIVLQAIARAFGFPGQHARAIFHQAKHAHLTGEEPESRQRDSGYGWEGQRQTGGGDYRQPRGTVTDRAEALAILGLNTGASPEDIKKRHRELVRKFHPDKHQHLGEVAAKEAEDRFRQVQAAYELLAG
jgi:DnaJ-domain-containing protein 1